MSEFQTTEYQVLGYGSTMLRRRLTYRSHFFHILRVKLRIHSDTIKPNYTLSNTIATPLWWGRALSSKGPSPGMIRRHSTHSASEAITTVSIPAIHQLTNVHTTTVRKKVNIDTIYLTLNQPLLKMVVIGQLGNFFWFECEIPSCKEKSK